MSEIKENDVKSRLVYLNQALDLEKTRYQMQPIDKNIDINVMDNLKPVRDSNGDIIAYTDINGTVVTLDEKNLGREQAEYLNMLHPEEEIKNTKEYSPVLKKSIRSKKANQQGIMNAWLLGLMTLVLEPLLLLTMYILMK